MTAGLALACWLVAVGEPDAAAVRDRLTLRIAAPASVVTELTARLTPRLAARAVALDVTPVPEVDFERLIAMPPDTAQDAPLARVWLDGRDPDRAVLFLMPRQGDRVLVRDVRLTAGFDEVALAQTAYIIDRAVASLLVSEPIGVPQSEARAAVEAVLPAAAPPAAETPRRRLFRLGAFGGVGAWSAEAPATARIGIEGSIERDGGAGRFGLAASAVADPGFHVAEPGADLFARSLALHLFATASWRIGGAAVGGIAVGPALIVTRIEPTLSVSPGAGTATFAPRTDFDPAFCVTARWELPLGRRTSVFLAAMVDVVPVRARYAETVQGQDHVLFSPWPVRPSLVLGVATGSELR
jgi:hypothetical protein